MKASCFFPFVCLVTVATAGNKQQQQQQEEQQQQQQHVPYRQLDLLQLFKAGCPNLGVHRIIIINPCKPYLSASATAPHPLGRRKAD
jgi:hypothetical protein